MDLFKGRHFDREIVVLCVRWYLTYKLSSRDLVQMMVEREILLTHTTILRWVQRFVPEFERRWNRYSQTVGRSWRCDETYVKVKVGGHRLRERTGRRTPFCSRWSCRGLQVGDLEAASSSGCFDAG